MKGLQPLEEILDSWRRCMRLGLANSITAISTHIKEDFLQTVLNESKMLTALFDDLGKDLEDLITSNNLAFLLTNPEGILLKKIILEK